MSTTVRTRRAQCYWEPIYNPDLVGKLTARDWNFTKDARPFQAAFDLTKVDASFTQGARRVFQGVRFNQCDFQGFSSNTSQIVFDKCEFIECDLSLSTFQHIKFSKCIFDSSSFGQAVFKHVEFRDCVWKKMGASSNETVFENVYLTNPAAFNGSLWTQLDVEVLKPRKVSRLNQWYRHELSKATIARTLLNSHRILGDDKTFYESVRVFETQQAYSKSCRAAFNVTTKWFHFFWYLPVALFWMLELGLLWLFGLLNAWGASALRPLIALGALWGIGAAYYSERWPKSLSNPLQASFDVTSVAAYTKSVSADLPSGLQGAMSVHLVVSLVLYSVFFATIVARLSRVR